MFTHFYSDPHFGHAALQHRLNRTTLVYQAAVGAVVVLAFIAGYFWGAP